MNNLIATCYYNRDQMRSVRTIEEFYKLTGVSEKIREFESLGVKVFMNKKDCERLLDYMMQQEQREEFREQWYISCQYDWVNNAPFTNNRSVPKGELWIVEI